MIRPRQLRQTSLPAAALAAFLLPAPAAAAELKATAWIAWCGAYPDVIEKVRGQREQGLTAQGDTQFGVAEVFVNWKDDTWTAVAKVGEMGCVIASGTGLEFFRSPPPRQEPGLDN